MKLVVSDTGPVHYLVLIGHIDVLPSIAEKILLPVAVRQELMAADAPDWLHVQDPPPHSFDDGTLDALDGGEKEAIRLAAALQADVLLLMDDRAGVRTARRKGLTVTGTIGILEEGARQGLLDFTEAFARLRETNFYCSQTIVGSRATDHVRLPALIADAGMPEALRFLEFFTVNIRNPNTGAACGRAAVAFLRWCEMRGLRELRASAPTVKQHFACPLRPRQSK